MPIFYYNICTLNLLTFPYTVNSSCFSVFSKVIYWPYLLLGWGDGGWAPLRDIVYHNKMCSIRLLYILPYISIIKHPPKLTKCTTHSIVSIVTNALQVQLCNVINVLKNSNFCHVTAILLFIWSAEVQVAEIRYNKYSLTTMKQYLSVQHFVLTTLRRHRMTHKTNMVWNCNYCICIEYMYCFILNYV